MLLQAISQQLDLKKVTQWLLVLLLTGVYSATCLADQTLHQPWQELLEKHVSAINNSHSTAVDYAAVKKDRPKLTRYLNALSKIDMPTFKQWSADKQLAFLINAYNAWTVELILTNYPELESIRDLASFFSSPWSKKFIPLLGKTRSLDNIEHQLIRGDNKYGDPRIHFAVNCASIGCPALRAEAYTEAKLQQQLAAQTLRFLTDKSRNQFSEGNIKLSAIFKWYGDDFALGFRGSDSLSGFILLYQQALNLTPAQQVLLRAKDISISFLDYDWALNDLR